MFHIPQAYHGVKEGQTYIFPPPPHYISPPNFPVLSIFFFLFDWKSYKWTQDHKLDHGDTTILFHLILLIQIRNKKIHLPL